MVVPIDSFVKCTKANGDLKVEDGNVFVYVFDGRKDVC